ncbi:hypothetical protein ATL41_2450 [Flavimobilis soli]|uniref:ATP synthase protein I n=1 Tax=Flavimobilis soli TaxID=442709 RepID=A0A2A9EGM1_9MICO|nr:hypothetical protein [Flavimobilis soli]PFG37681.1 hypothetical protein ATL41_2450 [Flavimobilis soli]
MSPEPAPSSAVRTAFGAVLRDVVVFVGSLTVLGALVGFLVRGTEGLWGALIGAAIAALFSLTTAVIMYATADKPIHVTTASAAGAWLGKMIVLVVVLVVLKDQEFYDKVVLFVVLTLAILGSLVVEMRGLAAARVPHVEPGEDPGASA